MKKILVTGGAGFIGSHVVELLCDKGFDVVIVDDLSFGYEKLIDKRAKFIKGSIGDPRIIEKALQGVDSVMHLAASSIIAFSHTNPLSYFTNNFMNGIVLLEAMRKNNVRKIVYSSTASVYGEPKNIPIREEDPKNPMSSYGSSKLAFEEALSSYYFAYGVQSVSLRYYNAYGPRDEQRPRTRAVPMWIEDILNNRSISWYWNGSQTRDYVFVKDIAAAHLAVMELEGKHIYNIGSGKGVVMREILLELEKIVGKSLKTIDKGERRGDPMKLVADISKIEKEVGWKPEMSLSEGLKITFEYYRNSHI